MGEYFWLFYTLIGIAYWAINIFVRKLHLQNDEGDGWFLVPFWVFLWPFCFIALIARFISEKSNKV
jgi:hypothetical protein